jgi:hypothetical protein
LDANEVLKEIADTLDTTVDFLISGDTDEKAASTLKDVEMLQQFRTVEQMDEDDKSTVKKLIDAFLLSVVYIAPVFGNSTKRLPIT